MSMTLQPGPASRRPAFPQFSGRIPLRIKLITAVLALVVIALTVISVASINLFRDYQIRHASQQVTALFDQQLTQIREGQGVPANMPIYAGFYLIAVRPVDTTLQPSPGASIPDIPTSQA